MKIGIAGLGGIGSNVGRHLVQSGVKHLKLVDYDRVELSNLNRQFYRTDQAGRKKTDCLETNLKAIFPDVCIEKVAKRIGPGEAADIFMDCDIVIEGLDRKHLKKMLIEELAALGKPIVSACGIAGVDLDGIGEKKIGPCHVVGDFSSDQDDHPLFPPKIAAIAARMAAIALNLTVEKS